jgi:hypothetical protein
MSNVQTMDCNPAAAVKLARVNFFNRQLLTADDMTTERDYFLQKLRRHNRFLHGWGVVCGLPVTAAPADGSPWRVQIGSGYALGPYGDEIFVGEAVYFDLAACISGGATSPCEPNLVTAGGAGTSTTAYLAIKYAECLARPVQVAASGCGCDDNPCQYSRINDSFQIQCLAQLPEQPAASTVTLCQAVGGSIAPCPPCPTNPWVVLAEINLPSASTMRITNSSIDTTVRRVIASTAVLQNQVVSCCCKQTPPPPPPPASVSLKSILVRTSAVAPVTVAPGQLGGGPGQPAGPWESSITLDPGGSEFDYELVLTGDAPAGGLPITVTASSSAVSLAQSSVTVPFQSSTQTVLNNGASTQNAVTVTLTATGVPGNTATAQLIIQAAEIAK